MLPFICTADTCLGRVDASSLSDQTRMELFISSYHPAKMRKFLDDSDTFLDVCDWDYVGCTADGVVITVDWPRQFHCATVSLDLLPAQLLEFDIQQCETAGTLSVEKLPFTMESFEIGANRFYGGIDLTVLAPNIQDFGASCNFFTGSIRLDRLPQSLTHLDLSYNAFEGTISLQALPKRMLELRLENNGLTGELYFGNLPKTMLVVVLDANDFAPVLGGNVPDFVSLDDGLLQ